MVTPRQLQYPWSNMEVRWLCRQCLWFGLRSQMVQASTQQLVLLTNSMFEEYFSQSLTSISRSCTRHVCYLSFPSLSFRENWKFLLPLMRCHRRQTPIGAISVSATLEIPTHALTNSSDLVLSFCLPSLWKIKIKIGDAEYNQMFLTSGNVIQFFEHFCNLCQSCRN